MPLDYSRNGATLTGVGKPPPVPPDSLAPRCIGQEDANYPDCLRALPRPPKTLWVEGALPSAQMRRVAMVGARSASAEFREAAREIAAILGQAGFAIISGGAFGIDAASHEGALQVGAKTYAVLGCGVDVVYPDRHGTLFRQIMAAGGLISEYPPGTPPRAGQFPARNRIMAALADVVIVVEAAFRSGSLITARCGRELGRHVLAMPGSPGTDALLSDHHAQPLWQAAKVLEALKGEEVAPQRIPIEDRFTGLLSVLSEGQSSPIELCTRLAKPLPAILSLLAEAELEGFVRRAAGNTYEVSKRASF